MNMNFLHHFQI